MKYKTFDGIRFTLQNNGYYKHQKLNIYLHRYVWEFYHGTIPKGYEIHHIDFDKSNNDISNLQCLERHEHKKLHADMLTNEQREWRRNNLNTVARPKAVEWHKSEIGRKWHSDQAKKAVLNTRIYDNKCKVCGKEFTSKQKPSNYCSDACKQKFRRMSGVDDVVETCCICGKKFSTNKYRKSKTCSRSCGAKLSHMIHDKSYRRGN